MRSPHRLPTIATVAGALLHARLASAAISSVVTGTPMGFASGATGGGDATPVYPTTVDELKTYLTSSDAQVIVVSGVLDFAGTEGTTTVQACDNYACTPDAGGQALLNTLDGCGSLALYDVDVDTAAYNPIYVASDKTLVGTDGATLNGKGLVFDGSTNVIIQNIKIENLNPAYVWGGDALAFKDATNIWIDHVTTQSLGRQHYSFNTGTGNTVTISNSFINGVTDYSATCDGHTYWGLELVGSADFITFFQNYIYYTSGRSPALSGNTVFHSVNNVWSSNSGHLLEGTDDGMGLYEGNYFFDTPVIADSGFVGQLFSSDAADLTQCQTYLGRSCVENLLGADTGSFSGWDAYGWFVDFGDRTIVPAASASSITTSVVSGAGNTL